MSDISIRQIRSSDCRIVWRWRNDPVARNMSLNSKIIPFHFHAKWYGSMLRSNTHLGVFGLYQNKSFGVLFCKVKGKIGNISVNLNPEFRGQNLSLNFLNLGLQFLTQKSMSLQSFDAQILKHNYRSIAIFRKAGFAISCKDNRSYVCRKFINRLELIP